MLNKQILRIKRKKSIRKKIFGTNSIPRLSVFRSNNHLFAQVINDDESKTIVGDSSKKSVTTKVTKKDEAVEFAKDFAKLMKSKNISTVVFDRNGYKYHGRIKEFADTLRSEGINL